MHRTLRVIFLLALITSLPGSASIAQQKPATAGASAKRPNVKSFIGTTAGVVKLTAEQGSALIGQPLTVVDDKKASYKISSYQFAYRRIGVTEDETTGKTSPQTDLVADRFTVTPLPAVWQQNVVDGLHAGEELLFFDIIVFDKQGRRFFAPDIKITIQ